MLAHQGPGRGARRDDFVLVDGQTDGQIAKPKLVKHQMYGRGKLDLLQARVIAAA